jgi:hypothetical protein
MFACILGMAFYGNYNRYEVTYTKYYPDYTEYDVKTSVLTDDPEKIIEVIYQREANSSHQLKPDSILITRAIVANN